ncbi:MAG: hypothetical protein ACFHWX_12840 [Bacteroidota bacterium]
MMVLMLLATSTISAATAPANIPASNEAAKVNELLTRLDEINVLDKSIMNSREKRELRKEVKSIKSELGELGGGVYISVGAIIIIVLLLILLL